MKTLPEPAEQQQQTILATRIWEDVVHSMHEYTHDSFSSKFLPPEEMLTYVRPIAAAFAQLQYTPLPTKREIYKSHLYALFYFLIICGIQMYLKERSITKNHAPYAIETNEAHVRRVKTNVMQELTEGIKVFPPLNHVMDIMLTHLVTPRRLERLPLKNFEFDSAKFDKFLPVTLLWGYLFARGIIIDK